MKSLKKTLSLVLVLVMVLGMFGIASASSFTDDNEIQYTEAVDVMVGIGAINGYTDGSFRPGDTINRAEAAKMVSYMVLGADVADALSGVESSFIDMSAPAHKWAIPYVEYLVSLGAVDGIGGDRFDPGGNVTAYEMAKMLLVCLGFEGDYTGSGWTLPVAVDANKIGLFEGRLSNASAYGSAATREECALYCFNALIYSENPTTVTVTRYIMSVSATGNDALTALAGTRYESLELGIAAAEATEDASAVPAVPKPVYGRDYTLTAVSVEEAVYSDSIASKVYGLTESLGTDSFGRPGVRSWIYKNRTISRTYVTAPVATYTTAVTQHTLYTIVGSRASAVSTTVNSAAGQTTGVLTAAQGQTSANAGTGITETGNGVLTEIYYYDGAYTAVQIVPTFDTVTSVTSRATTSTSGAYTTYTVGGLSGRVYSSVVDSSIDVDTAVITGTVAKDSPVVYYQDGKGTLYIEALTPMTGVLTAVSSTYVLTIDGASYGLARYDNVTTPTPSASSQTFYLDSNGYVAFATGIAAGTNYAQILQTGRYVTTSNSDGTTTLTPAVVAVTEDGSVVTLPYSDYTGTATIAAGMLVTYAATSTSGVYSLTHVSGFPYTPSLNDSTAVELTAIRTGNNTLTTTSGTMYANANTVFAVANFSGGVATGTVTLYTGIANVPSYTSVSNAYAVDLDNDGVADIVYMYDNSAVSSTSASFVYVIGTYTQVVGGYRYDIIVGGAYDTTVTISAADHSAKKLVAGQLYEEIVVDSSGNVTATSATPATNTASNPATGLRINGNLIYVTDGTGFTVGAVVGSDTITSAADTVPVYVVTTSTGKVDSYTATDVGTVTGASGVYVAYSTSSSGVHSATAIYVLLP